MRVFSEQSIGKKVCPGWPLAIPGVDTGLCPATPLARGMAKVWPPQGGVFQ